MPPAPPRFKLLLAGVALAAILVYANSLWNGFAYDDDLIIKGNRRVHQLSNLGLIWATPYWPSFGSQLGLYRPLAIFAYALEWAAGGGAPWVFHVVNVVLHALVTGLVFILMSALFTTGAAAVGALIFAVHPVHTEVVANSVGQAELIAAALMLAACVTYVRRPTAGGALSWPRMLIIVGLYFGALLAKEAAITLPALLILLDLTQKRLTFSKARLRAYIAHTWTVMFLLISAAVLYLAIRVDVLGSLSGLDAGPGLPFLREEHRILTALRTWPEYVRLLFFPKDLSNDYSPAVILPVESITPMAVLGALILVSIIGLALLTTRHPEAGFPAAWFFITILTVSNLLFPIGVVLAERTLYTPSVAVAAVVAYAWQHLQPRWTPQRRRLGYAGLILVVGLLSFRTVIRNPEWKNTDTILTTMIREHPESYRSAWLVADRYWRLGDLNRSAFYWEAAMRLWPRDSQLMGEFAYFNISVQNWRRAIELLEQSRAMHPWVPRTHEMLAFSYISVSRYEDAHRAAQEAIRFGGYRGEMLAVIAKVYEERGRLAEAAGAWRAATHEKGTKLWVYRAMEARALARYGDEPAALASADTARSLHARDSIAVRTISDLQIAIRRGCYRANADPECTDPVAGWKLTGVGPPTTTTAVTGSAGVSRN
ncbi:MAG: hypothetical protein WEE89_10380 [Gemmatimonadota bacterium]